MTIGDAISSFLDATTKNFDNAIVYAPTQAKGLPVRKQTSW